MEFINLKKQYETYKVDIDNAIRKVLEHGKYIMGPEIPALEAILADYVGVRHCISVASGTDSLEIALRALGIGTGDEVITVPFTWISSAEIISQVGARPVFVDISLETYNIDESLIESAITERTKAIIAVSLFGQMPNFRKINQIAGKYNICVIEDAAQSFGAKQGDLRSCGVTRIASTSFFPAKTFGCYGDGGALFTMDDALADRMRAIRSHGGIERHHHTLVGMNGRLDTLQASILLAKFPYFENEVAQREAIGSRYSDALRHSCITPFIAEGNTHVYAQYTIRPPDRNRLAEALTKHNIPTAVYYPKCLHEQPVFKHLGYAWGSFPQSEQASREVISLPMSPFLTEEEQNKVVKVVMDSL